MSRRDILIEIALEKGRAAEERGSSSLAEVYYSLAEKLRNNTRLNDEEQSLLVNVIYPEVGPEVTGELFGPHWSELDRVEDTGETPRNTGESY